MAIKTKTVLMLHLDQSQGQIWEALFNSHGVAVGWQSADMDVIQYLQNIESKAYPDLLVMDIGIKSPNSNSLQVVPVCQWCRTATVPVVLLNSGSLQIKPYEQKWAASKCGAVGIVTKLTQTTLPSVANLVMSTLDLALNTELLAPVTNLIVNSYTKSLGTQIAGIKEEALTNGVLDMANYRNIADPSLSETRIQGPNEAIMPISQPKTKVTTYRGVKVKKLQW